MAAAKLQFITKDFMDATAAAGWPRTLAVQLGRRFREVGDLFVGRFDAKRLRGRPGLFRRTGSLARSLQTGVTGESTGRLNRLGVSVQIGGPATPYAEQQEDGGVVHGRPFLAIPLPGGPAVTPAGVGRYASARDVPGLFVFRSRAGNLLLGKRAGRGGKELQPWYVLKRQVNIPARLGFEKSWNADQDLMRGQLQDAVDETAGSF